jgi:CubicO group peptidase (beta-lactamase class C family)
MKKNLSAILLIGFLFFIHGCDESTSGIIDVDKEILNAMKRNQIPSVIACVVKGDEIVWKGTYGYADISNSEEADRNSIFTIMSIGKLVLATAAFQLWEDGLLDLNTDINQYLPFEVRNPKFPDSKITPYLLLNHKSGLAWPEASDGILDFHHFYTPEEPPLIRAWLPQYILPSGDMYRESVWKEFEPGEQFLYSNIGASLLGLVIEGITNEDYRDYSMNHIFLPLKMLELQDPSSGTANLWVHCLGDCVGHLGGGTGFSAWAEWHFLNDWAMFIFSNRVNESISPLGRIYELVKYKAYKY